MPLYLCRWPNGDLSAVHACNRAEALYMLDEVGDPSAIALIKPRKFMVHFKLADKVEDARNYPLVFEDFGEEFVRQLGILYPIWDAVFMADEDPTDDAVKQALIGEQGEMYVSQPEDADFGEG